MSSPRLDALLEMAASEPGDAFLLYGIALEYAKLSQSEEAVTFFAKALQADPGYTAAYYHWGKTLAAKGDFEEAKSVWNKGVEVAKEKGDFHTLGELKGALEDLSD